MSDTLTPKVELIRQTIAYSPTGELTPTFSVRFMVGPHGPFTLQIPQSEFNQQAVQQKMQEVAGTIQSLTQ